MTVTIHNGASQHRVLLPVKLRPWDAWSEHYGYEASRANGPGAGGPRRGRQPSGFLRGKSCGLVPEARKRKLAVFGSARSERDNQGGLLPQLLEDQVSVPDEQRLTYTEGR